MKPSCLICAHPYTFLIKKNHYTLVRCSHCGLIALDPQPTDEVLAKLYSSDNNYHAAFSDHFLQQQTHEFNLRLHEAEKIHTFTKHSVLDVGATNGLFLDCARIFGFTTAGIEMNPATAAIARKNGHTMTTGIFDTYSTDNTFDLIHLGDVIEHVRNPRLMIEKCTSLLEEKGVVVVSTPNAASFFPRASLWCAKIFHLDWPHALPPAHTYQFSISNLNQLFEQKGFEPKRTIFTNTTYMQEMRDTVYFIAIYSYIKQKKGAFSFFIKNALLFIISGILYAPLWLIDEILFLITKKGSHVTVWYQKK